MLAISYNLVISSYFNPLIKGTIPVHRLLSMQFAVVLCVFVIVVLVVLVSERNGGYHLPIPSEKLFLMAGFGFGLHGRCLGSTRR